MAGVNAYGSYNGKVTNTDKNGNRVTKSDNNLSMDDFMNLLAAQMANQDTMNPATDLEFIGQMAQFTTLQAMKTLTELTMAQHGSSMVGKHVVVAHIDDRGEMQEERGVVSNVKFMGGVVSVTVNGNDYEMSSIMEVLTKEEFENPTPPKGEEGKDKDDGTTSKTPTTDNGTGTEKSTKVASAYAGALSPAQMAAIFGADAVAGYGADDIMPGIQLDYNTMKLNGLIGTEGTANVASASAVNNFSVDNLMPGLNLDYNVLKQNGLITPAE